MYAGMGGRDLQHCSRGKGVENAERLLLGWIKKVIKRYNSEKEARDQRSFQPTVGV